MTEVDAQLQVKEGAGTRQLNVDDFKAAQTGDATEATLLDVLAALGFVTVANPTADPETGLAKTLDVQAVLDRLPTALDNGSLDVADAYTTDGYDSATGDGTAQTLDFGAVYDLIWIRCEGANGFAKVTGTPAGGDGIFCEDGVPQPVTRRSQTIKVWAPATTDIYGWAYGN